MYATASWECHDKRGRVSGHATLSDARRTCINVRYTTPDSGRLVTIYDPVGRIVALFRDGRELTDDDRTAA